MLHLLAALSILVLALATGTVIHAIPGDGTISVSERAASKRWTYLLYATSVTVFGSIFWFYLYRDIAPGRELVGPFYIAVIGGWLGTLLFSWIPSRAGLNSMLGPHAWAVLLMGLGVTAIMAMAPFDRHNSIALRYIAGLVTLWYCYTIYLGIFGQHGPMRKYLLSFELINVGSFMVIMLALQP